jgi:hypothetical protein
MLTAALSAGVLMGQSIFCRFGFVVTLKIIFKIEPVESIS